MALGSRPAARQIGSPYSRKVFSISESRMPDPASAGVLAAITPTATPTIEKTDDRILARNDILEWVTSDDLPINSSVQGRPKSALGHRKTKPAPTSQTVGL